MRPAIFAGTFAAAVALLLFAQGPDLEEYYVQAFGPRIRLDRKIVGELRDAAPGTQIKLDEDGDGGIDAIYFRDDDERHSPEYRPLIVKALCPSGNFREGKFEMMNAIFAVDWRGDGTLDRVAAHFDDDGDGDIDRMLVATPFAIGPMHLVLAEDVSDDNRLWFHRNYQYDVPTGWWRSDWNGDEVFYTFAWDPARHAWAPRAEAPFAFYDNDRDGFSDEALRLEVNGRTVSSFRHSFDIDRDANSFQPHDYDYSLTGIGPVELNEADLIHGRIGIADTDPYIPWARARAWVQSARWRAIALTWDEDDNNVDLQSPNRFGEGERHTGFRNERWEGVLNHAVDLFPQIGGPSAGTFNRRTEVDLNNRGRMQLYYSPVDKRIHLRGADFGVMKVDFDLDGRQDMEYRFADRDRDGYFDTWEVDVNGDGVVDHSWGYLDRMSAQPSPPHEELPPDLTDFYVLQRRRAIDESVALIRQMKSFLARREHAFHEDEAERFWREGLAGYNREHGHGAKMRASLDTERYYADIVRERYFDRVLTLAGTDVSWRRQLLKLYGAGNFAATAAALATRFKSDPAPVPSEAARIRVRNGLDHALWRWPVIVDLESLPPMQRRLSRGFTIRETTAQLAPAVIPSQADDLDGDGVPDEFVFVTDLRSGEVREFSVALGASSDSPQIETSATDTWCDTGFARFGISGVGDVWFRPKRQNIVDWQPAKELMPGDAVSIVRLNDKGPFRTVRSGPLRAILRSRDGTILNAFREQRYAELRLETASPPVPIKGAVRRTHAGLTISEAWAGDTGVALLRKGIADQRVWVTGIEYGGERVPFWPVRKDWVLFVDTLAEVLATPPEVTVVRGGR